MEGWPEREGVAWRSQRGATLPLLTNCQTGGLKWDFSASWQLQQLEWREREGDSEDLVAASPYEPEGSPPSNGGNARESNPPSAVKRNNGFEDRGGHR